ncbi:hypothetical protein Scep_024182 [Stephania cephalantha]|uniref:Uncharacterized protein n=1 Tax=Stephania cephalantha TaxID=152367 RepID=A0AAP0HWW6_9MAGN
MGDLREHRRIRQREGREEAAAAGRRGKEGRSPVHRERRTEKIVHLTMETDEEVRDKERDEDGSRERRGGGRCRERVNAGCEEGVETDGGGEAVGAKDRAERSGRWPMHRERKLENISPSRHWRKGRSWNRRGGGRCRGGAWCAKAVGG